MKPIIGFKNFSFRYHSQKEPSLRDINLSIYPGEKVLIVGPSGSGKSTLASCINGLVPFSFPGEITGELTIAGEAPKNLGIFGLSKYVGTVLQDTDGQFVGLTVAEDIAFALENAKVPAKEMHQRVLEAAKCVEIENLLDRAPGELSGGQKQRVSTAGVMVDDVDVLLFDEPLANLDPLTGKRTMEQIDRIHRQQHKTILIIEHRIEDVLCIDIDRVILINDGRIVADTTPNELLAGKQLTENGIREPLYITALKYAGCRITKEQKPQHMETLELGEMKGMVSKWFEKNPKSHLENNRSSVLRVENLSYAYEKGKNVLSDISFDIKSGEMVSIVGKNGAGKSTLSGLICGFYTPDRGNIYWKNTDISKLSIKERGEKIGFVLQSPNQMISKPMIYEEVALGLIVRGVPEEQIKERVNRVLRICGLYPYRNWPVSALSYGQKKRVTIASILVLDPEVILLDEPTAGQDYRNYTEIMEFLREMNQKLGITIVMITHDMHLMLEYTDRALVLADGKLLADTAPANVLTDEKLAQKAYLKKTSLYDLAEACGISDAAEFVKRFIAYERKERRKRNGETTIL